MLRWGRLDSTQLHGKWKWNTFSKQDPLSYQLYCLISATWRRCVAYRHEWTKGRRAVVLLLSYLELLLADRYVGTSSFRFTLVFIDFTLSYPFASIYPAIRFPSHVYRILTCLFERLSIPSLCSSILRLDFFFTLFKSISHFTSSFALPLREKR
jgi:hypothetical protein